MNLYARELLRAWSETFPADELILVAGAWATDLALGLPNVRVVLVRRGGIFTRAWTQLMFSGWVARRAGADVLLSLSPIAAMTFPRARVFAVVHDWRHKRRPDEFGRGQRLYRRLWVGSLRRAQRVFAISEKTQRETAVYTGIADAIVVENGADHPRHWTPVSELNTDRTQLLTFGHFNNKRPEPVIEAVQILLERGENVYLTVLGARGRYRDELIRHAQYVGVLDHVNFPGFVDDETYQSLVQRADALILNSSDEGFGLPVGEALFFGVPVVAALDSGLGEIHGERVALADPVAPELATTIEQVISAPPPTMVMTTWAHASEQIRAVLSESVQKSTKKER